MITPPIALAAFAAATLTEESPMKTGFAAMRLGWVAYVIPFLFVFAPTLLMDGGAGAVLWDFLIACAGVFLVSVAMVGYLRRPLSVVVRAGFAVLGTGTLASLGPIPYANAAGPAFLVAAVAAIALLALRVPRADPT